MKICSLIVSFAVSLFIACSGSNDKAATKSYKLSTGFNTLESLTAAGLPPQSLTLKVYEIWASTSSTCASPTLIAKDANPNPINFANPEVLLTGKIETGKYSCFIAVVSNDLDFTLAKVGPDRTCVPNQKFTAKLCEAHKTTVIPDGAAGKQVTCTGQEGSDSKVALYFTAQVAPSTFAFDYLNPPLSELDRGHGSHLAYSPTVKENLGANLILQGAAIETKDKKCVLTPRFDLHNASI
jgi:hypothetical protein